MPRAGHNEFSHQKDRHSEDRRRHEDVVRRWVQRVFREWPHCQHGEIALRFDWDYVDFSARFAGEDLNGPLVADFTMTAYFKCEECVEIINTSEVATLSSRMAPGFVDTFYKSVMDQIYKVWDQRPRYLKFEDMR